MTELARLVSTLGPVSWSSWTMQVLQTVVTGRHPGMETKSCLPGIPDKRGESSRAFSDQPPLRAWAPGISPVSGKDVLGTCAANAGKQVSSASNPNLASGLHPPVGLPPLSLSRIPLPSQAMFSVGCGLWKLYPPPLTPRHTHPA